MADEVNVLKEWLNTIPDNYQVGIDDGGLVLRVVGHPEVYYEIGGIPEVDENGET